MTIDYDLPRQSHPSGDADTTLLQLTSPNDGSADLIDADDVDAAETYRFLDIDLSAEELRVRVVPQQADEFVCTSCFLVHHRSNLVRRDKDVLICRDCV